MLVPDGVWHRRGHFLANLGRYNPLGTGGSVTKIYFPTFWYHFFRDYLDGKVSEIPMPQTPAIVA